MNIALFCPNWVGDVVMATPALRAIRQHFRRDRIIGVLRPYVSGVLEGGEWFDDIVRFGGATWADSVAAVAYKLRRIGIDLAVLFPNSFRSAFTAWMGGCTRIVGYARDGRTMFLTDRLDPLPTPEHGPFGVDRGTAPAMAHAPHAARSTPHAPRSTPHAPRSSLHASRSTRYTPSPIIDYYNRLAEYVGCPDLGRRMMLATTADDEAAADRIWTQFMLKQASTVVAFNPGAAFGSAKLWPAEYFAALARKLVDERHASVLVLCGPAERDLAREIVERADRPGVHSLAETSLSLGLIKACVRRADVLVTTDSGPRHFAAAFDRPVVTLFGPTHIEWTETFHPKAIHLQKQVDCGPCQKRECPLDHRCMKLLTAEEVYGSTVSLLDRYPRLAGDLGGAPPVRPLRLNIDRRAS